ncbi:hypothetical protein H2248_011719 [Termitomyces sp. 'cryptogamus']|nr:hypothetical protein H2248_011719 [Termitomyces sp. 'cryptogamus']
MSLECEETYFLRFSTGVLGFGFEFAVMRCECACIERISRLVLEIEQEEICSDAAGISLSLQRRCGGGNSSCGRRAQTFRLTVKFHRTPPNPFSVFFSSSFLFFFSKKTFSI